MASCCDPWRGGGGGSSRFEIATRGSEISRPRVGTGGRAAGSDIGPRSHSSGPDQAQARGTRPLMLVSIPRSCCRRFRQRSRTIGLVRSCRTTKLQRQWLGSTSSRQLTPGVSFDSRLAPACFSVPWEHPGAVLVGDQLVDRVERNCNPNLATRQGRIARIQEWVRRVMNTWPTSDTTLRRIHSLAPDQARSGQRGAGKAICPAGPGSGHGHSTAGGLYSMGSALCCPHQRASVQHAACGTGACAEITPHPRSLGPLAAPLVALSVAITFSLALPFRYQRVSLCSG